MAKYSISSGMEREVEGVISLSCWKYLSIIIVLHIVSAIAKCYFFSPVCIQLNLENSFL